MFGDLVHLEIHLAPIKRPLPRLDAFYLRGEGQLEAWGTTAFRRRITLRASLRRVRAALTGRPQ